MIHGGRAGGRNSAYNAPDAACGGLYVKMRHIQADFADSASVMWVHMESMGGYRRSGVCRSDSGNICGGFDGFFGERLGRSWSSL